MKQLSVLLIIIMTSCSIKKQARKESNSEIDKIVNTSSFYEHSKSILESMRNRKSTYYRKKVLKIFNETPDKLKDNESVALMYVGISHQGFQHPDLKKIENNCYNLYNEKKYSEANEKADQALSIFPFSLKAIWVKYLLNEKNKTLRDYYFHQLRSISIGIMSSGNSYKEGYLQIVFDDNCFYIHSTYLVPEAKYKIKERYNDNFDNVVFTCTNTFEDEELFIIPNKTWANNK